MKQRIAILITNFEGGGAQKIALTHARALQSRGYTIQIIALEHQDSYDIPDDLPIHFLSDIHGKSSKLNKLLIFGLLPLRLFQYLRKNHITLCISHLERADFVNILTRLLSQHQTISVIHSHLTTNYTQEGVSIRSLVYLNLVKILERFSSQIVSVSKGIEIDLVRLGLPKARIQTILNPFDIEHIRELAEQQLPEEYQNIFASPTLLSIGRLSRQKGFWHSVKAFVEVKKSHPTLKYIVLGDGPMRTYHLELAQSLGLRVYSVWDKNISMSEDYDIYFLGFQQNPFAYLKKATLFILPSHYEGLPNVLVESLILGTPVIASDSDSGPRELLAPQSDITMKSTMVEFAQYGILVPPMRNILPELRNSSLDEPEQELVKGIIRILSDEKLRDKYQIMSEERITDFQLNPIIDQWEKLIDTIVQ